MEKDGAITAYDLVKKKMLYSFPLKIDRVKVTTRDKERYLDFFKVHPNTRQQFHLLKKQFKFPEYFPLIRASFVKRDKIYIRTYKQKEGKSEFYLFDLKGALLARYFLPMAEGNGMDKKPYTIMDNKIYQLVEGEDEVWELHAIAFK